MIKMKTDDMKQLSKMKQKKYNYTFKEKLLNEWMAKWYN